ncbi:branched-chain amino acid ABC transporter permease [Micromonospora sp. HUAS LYJ1]|uniref:branched-chain amino acid ABC transporter permease n=1 Tax=Micromonospora sp. HUAS LYJ1 TaxID=3061626 RepID=UPI002672C019|nr:branched-chain amino acid ABC transporter permease [Micromonospora sp. HUAS LYJ1]WKU03476.1 branched-chain amino acid ABC transporter permease [Micromonospora sp. HUAS LYJ1]WKU07273.1 branched-chain amino acid ABC transporter permease [Micromonospora sp. HUAS LYJ1]
MGTYLIPGLDGIAYGLLLAIAAAGLTLAFGAGGVLNLAHGTLIAAGGYVAATTSTGSWPSLIWAILAASVVGAVGGGVLAALTAALAGRGHLDQALLTFGIALIGADLLTTVFGADIRRPRLPAALDTTLTIAGHPYPADRLAALTAAVAIAAIGYGVLHRTRAGRLIRATVDDRHMVAGIGVDPRVVNVVVLVASGALAGLAGALCTPILGVGPGTAPTTLLLSLVIVVCGGLGSVPGAVVAAIGVGLVQTIGVITIPALAPYLLLGAMALLLLTRRRTLPGMPG